MCLLLSVVFVLVHFIDVISAISLVVFVIYFTFTFSFLAVVSLFILIVL
jgi:hypothetical protein